MIFDNMIGKTMSSVTGSVGDDEMIFTTIDNKKFMFCHFRQCCEDVLIEDITGDLSDLVGSVIVQAEEILSEFRDGGTYTFYKFATIKGYVTVRWFGSSNYSEDVSYTEC